MSKNRYVKLTHKEHILKRSETYVGSKTTEEMDMYVVKDNNLQDIKIIKRKVKNNPAFIKLFDEILTNASDHAIRDGGGVKNIKINIDKTKISVENDGTTIPIQKHPEEKVYNAELIFSHLLTGENYDDTEERMVGGRNGLGAKLVNVFSTKFRVECCDGKKIYRQWSKKNMQVIDEPEIIKTTDKPFTRITYYPDYSQFDFDTLTEDLMSIMYKRCLDVAAYIPEVRITLNGKLLPIRKISDFMKMHLEQDADLFYEKLGNGWELGIAKSNEYGFTQTSIVNGISTHRGGSHVNHASLMVSKAISDKIKKTGISWNDVKNKIHLFLICKIPNPSFDTQTKEYLQTPIRVDIHQNAEVSENTIKKILKSDIVQTILDEHELKEKMHLKNLGGGKKTKVSLTKLQDANKAGTKDSDKCFLFLCEGDSAVTMAISGMSVVGRDYYGAFPLKGKVLNVRDQTGAKIRANEEIKNLIDITGLEFGKKYTSTSELRYGKVVLMTDADVDGVHIKALLMNFFENNWPELLKMDFLYEFITPVLKATKGKDVKNFYTIKEYQSWLNKNPVGWKMKYYKGLGTSTSAEAKEYFKELKMHLLPFEWDTDLNHDYIDMLFRKDRANDRKEWMLKSKPVEVEKYKTPTPISSFVNNEMITFSLSDVQRSIPSLYDGLKPSQRKILYAALKKNITEDYGVASLAGVVKSETRYHHGEKSLEDGIINLAQDFIGSNNLPLLNPKGQFGTRLQGGADSASPRYLNTHVNKITKAIFDKRDNQILNYLEDDGYSIEPETFKPLIPMILVNGALGVGTGWSTFIPQYDPNDIIRVIENRINKKKSNRIHPKYKNFKGEIVQNDTGYITYGKYEILNSTTIRVTELPIGCWTQDFITHLYELINGRKVKKGNKEILVDVKFIRDFVDHSSETDVNVTINIPRENMIKLNKAEHIISKFNLSTRLSTTNMHLFVDGKITKFDTAEEIIDVFFEKRLLDYTQRKNVLLSELLREQSMLDNQVRFIKMVIADTLKINNRKKDLIVTDLKKNKFDEIDESYDYLLRMPIYSLTKEKIDELSTLAKGKAAEHKALKISKVEDLWLEDLAKLKKEL